MRPSSSILMATTSKRSAMSQQKKPTYNQATFFENGQMLVCGQSKASQTRSASPWAEQPVGLHHSALAVHPLGLYRVQPRALVGNKQLMTPYPFYSASPGGCARRSTAYLVAWRCQLALSQTNTHTLLANRLELLGAPIEKSSRYAATGRPSTKRSHVCSNSGK